MRYDLHIHSALSPCASDDMTPNNIINMAKLCGLDVISVCDHNSFKQQSTLKKIADKLGIHYIYGIEIQTSEEVHICGYFEKLEDIEHFQKVLDENLLPIENDIHYFGNQYLMNELDEVVHQEKVLLLQSVNLSIDDVCKLIHDYHGFVSLAHVCDRNNSILTQLGFIPDNLLFDFIEVNGESQKQRVLQMHPFLKDVKWLMNSDAHYLQDIDLFESEIEDEKWNMMWRHEL